MISYVQLMPNIITGSNSFYALARTSSGCPPGSVRQCIHSDMRLRVELGGQTDIGLLFCTRTAYGISQYRTSNYK